MRNLESCLPQDICFDSAMMEMQDLIDAQLMHQIHDGAGNIIDPLESRFEWVEKSVLSGRDFGFYFLGVDYQDEPQAREAVVRAAKFALNTVDCITVGQPMVNLGGYLPSLISEDADPEELLRRDVQNYLNDRPAIDAFVEYYAAELDTQDRYSTQLQTICGLMFMLSERELADEYIVTSFANAVPEDFFVAS